MTVTLTITDFLEQRLAEDEAAARAALDRGFGGWEDFADRGVNYEERTHIVRHDPTRVLAECAAKRAIVELHSGSHECPGGGPGGWTGDVGVEAGDLCPTLRLLAAAFPDHPDYRDEWAA